MEDADSAEGTAAGVAGEVFEEASADLREFRIYVPPGFRRGGSRVVGGFCHTPAIDWEVMESVCDALIFRLSGHGFSSRLNGGRGQ